MDYKRIIGIDIGGTNFRIGAVCEDGTVDLFRKIPVGEVFHTNDGLDDLANYLTGSYFPELRKTGITPCAVSIGFPATLDRQRSVVLQAPNIPFMENLPVKDGLSRILGIPVVIENDVNMALCYDRAKYRIPKCEVLIGCYFGTGIGSALQVYGHILTGKGGSAGELGHIPVDGSEERCGCGNTGCMENLAGGKYLAKLCKEVYTDTYIGDLFEKHGTEPLLLQFVDRMAMAVATEINILDPDYLLIGGGVVNMKGFPREYLMQQIQEHARKPFPAEGLKDTVIVTDDEEDKCIIGAARFAADLLGKL